MNTVTTVKLSTQQIADRFHELAQKEQWFDIQDELFSEDVESIEPENSPYFKNAEGKATVKQKGMDWVKKVTTVHSARTSAPIVAGNIFCVSRFKDITVAGIGRFQLDQIMMYKVADGKITMERFFYDAPAR
ncbi:hypothetical protein COR50_17920 [Chitinophaga caeni]|uniref:SnoaL-like domain-containing protein n=1 Tax=Chitinophaga caeni TaxID=2029983 RepID=A0A291QYD7_9BACT|nr:SnoaL-like domain-containing protein [Chitinophaga caeni]ATL48892.1 hypothetical protein COR50_17920 [Chitinophaga caeni]